MPRRRIQLAGRYPQDYTEKMKRWGKGMKRKYLDMRGWRRVEKRREKIMRMENAAFCGYAAAIWRDKVKGPFVKSIFGHQLALADAGYLWVQLPDGKNWALTVMYNERREVIQFYFDITRQNTVPGDGRPCFDDLYLDVVFLPDGSSLLLDEDELDGALQQGEISKEQAAMARQQAQVILQKGEMRELMELSRRLLEHFEP